MVSLRYVTWLRPGARLEVLNRVGIPPLMCCIISTVRAKYDRGAISNTQEATVLETAGCHWLQWPVGHGNILFIHLLRPNGETLVCLGTKDSKHNTHRRGIAG